MFFLLFILLPVGITGAVFSVLQVKAARILFSHVLLFLLKRYEKEEISRLIDKERKINARQDVDWKRKEYDSARSYQRLQTISSSYDAKNTHDGTVHRSVDPALLLRTGISSLQGIWWLTVLPISSFSHPDNALEVLLFLIISWIYRQ